MKIIIFVLTLILITSFAFAILHSQLDTTQPLTDYLLCSLIVYLLLDKFKFDNYIEKNIK